MNLVSHDREEICEIIESAYGASVTLAPPQDDHRRLTLSQLGDGNLAMNEIDVPFHLDYAKSPQADRFVFTTLLDGAAQFTANAETVSFGRGDVFIAQMPDVAQHGQAQMPFARTIAIDTSAFDEVLAREPDEDPRNDWRFLSRRPLPGGARHWRQASAAVRRLLEDDACSFPLVLGPATRFIAATALMSFPNNAGVATGDRHSERDAHPAALRRAIAFIDTNPDLDITLADIARAAHVSTRALQLAFRRHLQTTPMAYLRTVRLGNARLQLQHASPDEGLTVTQVAMQWGFANPSHFAQHYRAAFGESPSTTLER